MILVLAIIGGLALGNWLLGVVLAAIGVGEYPWPLDGISRRKRGY